VKATIDHTWTPTVEISIPDDGRAWVGMTITEEGNRETQGRKPTRARRRKLIHWSLMVPKLRGGTAWIDRLSSFL
jgi:hypothetical protein